MKPEFIYMNLIAPSFIFIPVVIGLIRYRKLPSGGKALLYYLILDTIVSALSSWMAYNRQSNLALYHFATLADTVLLLYFFHEIFRHPPSVRIIRVLMVLFPLLCILNIFFLQPLTAFNSYTLSLKALLIIALCFLYWWHHELPEGQSWGNHAINWILSGLLLYFSSSFILLTFSNVIIAASASKNISLLLWNIHATLNIIMFLLLAAGLRLFKHE